MKNILIIVLMFISFGAYAQTDRELLLELVRQQTETNKQIAETNKQVAVIATKVDGLDKRIDSLEKAVDKRFDDINKRFDILFYIMLTLLAGIFGLVGFVFWDRRTLIRPIEDETKKEIELLKARETKTENILKKILEKFPDLANLA